MHYRIDEKLELTERLRTTKLVKKVLRREKKKLADQGIKISMAKLGAEAILEKYNS